MAEYITMEEMTRATYNGVNVDALEALRKGSREFVSYISTIQKSDYLTTTTGIYNPVFGAMAWINVCQEAGAFGVLPKQPYEKAGYRIITAFADAIGVAEGSALPEATAHTFDTFQITLKTIAEKFSFSDIMAVSEGKDDAIKYADLVVSHGKAMNKSLNKMLCTTFDTPAGLNMESLHRLCGGYDEGSLGSTPTDVDIYGKDRHTTPTAYDGQVITGATPGTADVFALAKLDEVIARCQPYWDNPNDVSKKVFLTGFDTAMRISQLLSSYQLINPTVKVKFSVNGVETYNGTEGGVYVASYNGIPVIATNDLPKTGTNSDLTDILLVDTEYTSIAVGQQIQYFESNNKIDSNYLGKTGLYEFVGELVCTKPRGNGKIRDIKKA